MITTAAPQPAIGGGSVPAASLLPRVDNVGVQSSAPLPVSTTNVVDKVYISTQSQVADVQADGAVVPSSEQAEQAKRDYIEKSSAAYRAFFYPISDVRFTIYKDSTGQYITRFTNLVDGSVTHIPEEDIITMARMSGDGALPMFSTEI